MLILLLKYFCFNVEYSTLIKNVQCSFHFWVIFLCSTSIWSYLFCSVCFPNCLHKMMFYKKVVKLKMFSYFLVQTPPFLWSLKLLYRFAMSAIKCWHSFLMLLLLLSSNINSQTLLFLVSIKCCLSVFCSSHIDVWKWLSHGNMVFLMGVSAEPWFYSVYTLPVDPYLGLVELFLSLQTNG